MASVPHHDPARTFRRKVRRALRERQLPAIEPEGRRTRKDHVLVMEWDLDPDRAHQLCRHVREQFRNHHLNAYVVSDLDELLARASNRQITIRNVARTSNAVALICTVEGSESGPSNICREIVNDLFPTSPSDPPTDRRLKIYVHGDVAELPTDDMTAPLGTTHPTFRTRDELVKKAGRDITAFLDGGEEIADPPGSLLGLLQDDPSDKNS